jgi:hypothetical protein
MCPEGREKVRSNVRLDNGRGGLGEMRRMHHMPATPWDMYGIASVAYSATFRRGGSDIRRGTPRAAGRGVGGDRLHGVDDVVVVTQSIYLSIYLYIYLSIYRYVYLYVHLSIYLYFKLYLYLSIYLPIHMSMYVCFYLS